MLVLASGASYVRFMITHDYLVAYEGTCDPTLNTCFIGCNDDECTEEYYYAQVQKTAVNIEKQCGIDITDCENANICLPNENDNCMITYCNPEIDGDSCTTNTEIQ